MGADQIPASILSDLKNASVVASEMGDQERDASAVAAALATERPIGELVGARTRDCLFSEYAPVLESLKLHPNGFRLAISLQWIQSSFPESMDMQLTARGKELNKRFVTLDDDPALLTDSLAEITHQGTPEEQEQINEVFSATQKRWNPS